MIVLNSSIVFISCLAVGCLVVDVFAATYSFIVFAWLFVELAWLVVLAVVDSSNVFSLVDDLSNMVSLVVVFVESIVLVVISLVGY